jgi:hydrogenase maturation protease
MKNRTEEPARRILVLGIGNPGRRDDGLGPELVGRIERAALSGVDTDANYQLNVEDALACSTHDFVIFVDASNDGPEPYSFTEIAPSPEIAFSTHELAPASVLALCEELYGRRPKARLLAVRGCEWEIGEGLSPRAARNLTVAEAFLISFLRERSSHHH